MKLLVLSNGHGEDQIAVRIIKQLQIVTNQLELIALPIVGQGYSYSQLNIPLAGKVQQMPSGGFIYMGGNPLWQDLQGGLIQLTLEQIKVIRQWGQKVDGVLAVGDIVPLLYAWLSRANYVFVGTAKSEYYLRNETGWLEQTSWLERQMGSVYLPWERWLMNRPACKAVFPRDSLTTTILKRWSIPAYDLGNPMMDEIGQHIQQTNQVKQFSHELDIVLLPGSRIPEALNNWQQILEAITSIIDIFPEKKLKFLAAIAPAVELDPFISQAVTQGWHKMSNQSDILDLALKQDAHRLTLSQNRFAQFIQRSDLAVAMAGTATEELVGLGKPAITMPGQGPQFTYAFAEAQSRLLGCSIIMVNQPQQVGTAIANLINDSALQGKIALNGKARLGTSGASHRIAQCIQEKLLQ